MVSLPAPVKAEKPKSREFGDHLKIIFLRENKQSACPTLANLAQRYGQKPKPTLAANSVPNSRVEKKAGERVGVGKPRRLSPHRPAKPTVTRFVGVLNDEKSVGR